MMVKRSKYYQDNFIARWISGEISFAEQVEFEKWLTGNPEDKKYFNELQWSWKCAGQLKIKSRLSAEERWNSISETIHGGSFYKAKKTGVFKFWQAASIAAAIIMMVAVYYWTTSDQLISEFAQRGEHKTIFLPGGSEVTLNAASSLKYKKRNWDKKREVFLIGEAFFNVTHGKEFVVKSNFVVIKVLGTSFNIRSRNNKVEVACVTGKVSVESSQQNFLPLILNPAFKSLIIKNQIPAPPIQFKIKNKTGWLTGNYVFDSIPLSEVFEEIERQFNCHVILKRKMGERTYSGGLDSKSVEKSIEMVCLSAGLRYSSTGTSEFIIY